MIGVRTLTGMLWKLTMQRPSHNSEQLYQVVKNFARKQSKGFKCTRIRLENGTLASQYDEAQARWLRFHAGESRCKDSV